MTNDKTRTRPCAPVLLVVIIICWVFVLGLAVIHSLGKYQ